MYTSLGLPELFVLVALVAAVVWPASRVCAKAGYSPWLGLVTILPGANILLLWFLALAEWPRKVQASDAMR
jgi:energy-converting hydrogenase Eha subunit B